MTAVVGTPLQRKEDPPLLTGEARFVADLAVPGALHFALVRSHHANARITSIDGSEAAAMPGVVAVYTGADLADDWAAPMPCAWPVTDDMKNPPHRPIAVDHACYMGDAVAVVVANSAYEARDAAEAVLVEYAPLAPVVDLEDALADTVVLHEELGTNTSYTWELTPDPAAVDAAFAAAEHTVRERYVHQRLIPAAIEPRGVCVVPQPFAGEFTIYSSTQIPHILKIMLAITCGLPEHKLRVVAPSVGGALRLEARRVRRGGARAGAGEAAGAAGRLGRGAQREQRWRRSRVAARSRTSSWRPTRRAR